MTISKEQQQEEQNARMDEVLTTHASQGQEEEEDTPPTGSGEEQEAASPETQGEEAGAEGGEVETDEEEDTLAWLEGREEPRQEEPEGGEEEEDEEEPETPPAGGGDDGEEEDEPTGDNPFEISNEDFEEITTSPERLQKFASEIYNKALEESRKEVNNLKEEFQQQLDAAKQELLQNIPDVVQKSADRAQATRQLVTNFYDKYPDLREKKQYVRDMIKTVQSNNSDWSAQQVLNEVAGRAKRDFGITEKAEKREQKRRPNPKFAGAGGRRAPSGQEDTRTTQQKLLDETIR